MLKLIELAIIVFVIVLGVAYVNDPNSIKPWQEASWHAGGVVAHAVKDVGEVTNKAARDYDHKDSPVAKTVDTVKDAGTAVKEAVVGK